MDAAELLLLITGNSAGAMTAMKEVEGGMAGLDAKSAESSGFFANFAGFVGKAFLGVGVAVAAAGVITGKMAADYEQATTEMQTNSQMTAEQAKAVGDAFLDTAGKSVFSAKQMMEALAPASGEFTLLLGRALSAGEAVKIMAASEDLAQASGTSLKDATKALADVMLTFKIPVDQAGKATDTLYGVSKATGIGVTELTGGLLKLKGRLGELSPSLQDTGALLVEMAENGIRGSRGMMMVNTALTTLTTGGKSTQAEIAKLGLHVYDANGQFVGMSSIIDQLQPKLAGMTEQNRLLAEKELFGASAGRVMGEIIAGGSKQFDLAAASANRLGAAHDAAETRGRTFNESMQKLLSTFEDIGIKVGQHVLPYFHMFVDAMIAAAPTISAVATGLVDGIGKGITLVVTGLQDLWKWFGNLPPVVQGVISPFGLLLTHLQDAARWVSTAVGAIQGFFSNLRSGMDPIYALAGAMQHLGATTQGAWDAIHVGERVISAIGEVFRGIMGQLNELWQAILPSLKQAWNEIKPAVQQLQQAMGPLLQVLGGLGLLIMGLIGGAFKAIIEVLKVVIPAAIHILVLAFKTASDIIALIADILTGKWGDAAKRIGAIFKNLVDAAYTIFTTFFAAIIGAVKGFVEGIIGFFQWLFDKLVGHSLIPDLVNGIINFFAKLPGAIAGLIGQVVSTVTGAFTGLIGKALSWGGEMIQALARGISGAVGAVGNAIGGAVNFIERLNPFHHESPSLVENVEAGVGRIVGHYQSMAEQIRNHMATVRGSIDGASLGGLSLAAAGPNTGAAAGGLTINQLDIHNPASGVNIIQALLDSIWLQRLQEGGRSPAPTS